jgi:hypothetical protein
MKISLILNDSEIDHILWVLYHDTSKLQNKSCALANAISEQMQTAEEVEEAAQ